MQNILARTNFTVSQYDRGNTIDTITDKYVTDSFMTLVD